MDTNTNAPAQGDGQGQGDTQLDTAMGGWGDGEGQQQAAPAQTQQSQGVVDTTRVPAQPSVPASQVASPGGTTPAQAAVPTQDTAALIRAAVDSTAQAMVKAQGQSAQMQQAQRTMTDEEFATRYGITKYDAKYVERLFDKDPAKAADVLNEIQRNSYTSAVRMANDLLAAQKTQMEAAYGPRFAAVEKFIAEQNEVQATSRFYKNFPDLAPESDLVKEVLDATQAKISRGELKFTDEKQAFQYVADATNKVVSRMQKSTGNGNGQQSQPAGRQMASATQSARPGGQSAKPKGGIDDVMDSWNDGPAD